MSYDKETKKELMEGETLGDAQAEIKEKSNEWDDGALDQYIEDHYKDLTDEFCMDCFNDEFKDFCKTKFNEIN